jgi:hypothetical protein
MRKQQGMTGNRDTKTVDILRRGREICSLLTRTPYQMIFKDVLASAVGGVVVDFKSEYLKRL